LGDLAGGVGDGIDEGDIPVVGDKSDSDDDSADGSFLMASMLYVLLKRGARVLSHPIPREGGLYST